MRYRFEELDDCDTPIGQLSLRVRGSVALEGRDVYEVTLNGEFLMSSVVNQSEKALAELALARLGDRACDVLIGGLGLGYTAAAALEHDNVRSVRVIEYLEPVIRWHRERLVPAADTLLSDPRCELVHADFFEEVGAEVAAGEGEAQYDAILLDIDHSPESLLDSQHGRFYTRGGLERLAGRLKTGGIFGLWSAEQPADAFLEQLREVFADVSSHVVKFTNPMLHVDDENVIVLAQ